MATYVTLKSKTKLGCDICDRCCVNRGDIKITPVNVLEISRYMKISPQDFINQYTTEDESQPLEIVIKASSAKGDKNRCILNDKTTSKCKIHPVKPMQCVTFPLIPVDLKRDIFYKQDTCECFGQSVMPVIDWLNGKDGIYVKYKKIYMEWIAFIEDMQKRWPQLDAAQRKQIFETVYYNYDGGVDVTNKRALVQSVRMNIKLAQKIAKPVKKEA